MSDSPNLTSAFSLKGALFGLADPDDIAEELRIREWEDHEHLLKEKKFYHSDAPIMRSLLSALQREKIIAYGRINNELTELTKIPSRLWFDKLFLDLKEGRAKWSGPPEMTVYDIRILRQQNNKPARRREVSAKRRVYDWNRIISYLILDKLFNDGLPKGLSELSEHVKAAAERIKKDRVPDYNTMKDYFNSHSKTRYPNFWRQVVYGKDNKIEQCHCEWDDVMEEFMLWVCVHGLPPGDAELLKLFKEIVDSRNITQLTLEDIEKGFYLYHRDIATAITGRRRPKPQEGKRE